MLDFDQDPRLLYIIEESQGTSCPCLSGVKDVMEVVGDIPVMNI
jgi:hypothetical protein